MDSNLAATSTIDSDHPEIIRFARELASGHQSDADRAVSIYYGVRDGFRYDPYRIDLSEQGLRASTTLSQGYG